MTLPTPIADITIAELLEIERMGARVHTCRANAAKRLQLYISNLSDMRGTRDNNNLSYNTRKLLTLHIANGDNVITLI